MRLRFLAATLALAACGAAGDGRLAYSELATCARVESATERVFHTAEEWRAFLSAEPGSTGSTDVDFGTRMIVARFDGAGSACTGFTVESVEEKDGSVVVRATRHISPNPCVAVVAYPQLVLAVDRKDLPVAFRITVARDQGPAAAPCM